MTQAISKTVTFDEFIAWYPENSEYRYELHDGIIIEMPKPTGDHSEIAGFILAELNFEIKRLQLPYFIPKECIVKSSNDKSGYEPDIIVLARKALENEPRWKQESIITMGSSIRLAVEVVSTNWRDDYFTKTRDYGEMGISEYWIIDYLGLGGMQFIGNPKRPTFSVYELIDDDYQVRLFRDSESIESPTFPELNLTAKQVFEAGGFVP
jgi:Uma2 family endonuclease